MEKEYIVKLRESGKSIREVAEIMQVSVTTAKKLCKQYGVAGRMSDRKPLAYRNQWTFERQEELARHRAANNGLLYIKGYTSSNGYVSVKCCKCGHIFDISMITLRKKAKGTRCPKCRRNEVEDYREKKAMAKAKANAEAKKKSETQRIQNALEKSKQLEMRLCQECGDLFIPKGNHVCCSPECSRRRFNNHKDRRLKTVKEKDYSITLKKLAKRDNDKCWICGRVVDWDDYSIVDETIIAGNNYPSIDHVIPLAKGGQHVWENVKLAHRICNSLKSDKIG